MVDDETSLLSLTRNSGSEEESNVPLKLVGYCSSEINGEQPSRAEQQCKYLACFFEVSLPAEILCVLTLRNLNLK